jgi:hypothetical protein
VAEQLERVERREIDRLMLLMPNEALERIRENTLARYWSALYQQNPVPDEGELFSPDKIGLRDWTDDVVQWVRGWDLAGSKEGDYTVGAMVGRTKDGRFVVGLAWLVKQKGLTPRAGGNQGFGGYSERQNGASLHKGSVGKRAA